MPQIRLEKDDPIQAKGLTGHNQSTYAPSYAPFPYAIRV